MEDQETMKTGNTRQILFKIGLAIVIVLLIILGGIQFFLSFYLEDFIETRLINAVSLYSDHQYDITFNELSLSFWNRKMEMSNVNLHPADSSSTAPRIKFDQLFVTEIQFFQYLMNGYIRLGEVQLINPALTIVENSPDSLVFFNRFDDFENQKKPSVITVNHFFVDGGSVNYQTYNQNSSRAEVHDINLSISGLQINSNGGLDPLFFDYESITTTTGRQRFTLENGLYAIETYQTQYSSTEKTALIDSLKLIPQFSKYEFSRHIGHQKDRLSLTVNHLNFENLNIRELQKGALIAEKFTIDSANLHVFRSKLLPDKPERIKRFPQVVFQNLDLPVRIDTIAIQNSEVIYSEHHPGVAKPGMVSFSNIDGFIMNTTNDVNAVKNGDLLTMDITSNVMGSARLNARFTFPMDRYGSHNVEGSLTTMQAEDLNSILEPIGLVRAENGTLHSMDFMMDLKSDSATGWVELVYSDLKIAVLDRKNVGDGGRKWFKSFMANRLKIKSDNDKQPYRRGQVEMKRDHTKSIFSYWWKSLSTGLQDNIGL